MSQNPVPFRRITDSLYQIGADSPDNPTFLYFVTAATPNSGPVSLADSWQNPDFPGYYVMMTHPVPPGREGPLVRALRRILPDPGAGVQIAPARQRGVTRTSNRSLVWLDDGAKSSRNWRFSLLPLVQIDPQSTARKVFSDNDFSCGAFTLRIGANQTDTLSVDLNEGEGRWEIKRVSTAPFAREFVKILFGGTAPEIGYYQDTWLIYLFLAGPQTGCYSVKMALDPAALRDVFGCEFRYVLERGRQPLLLRYPFFDPPAPQSPAAEFPGFNLWLNPLWGEDAGQTRLAFDLSSGESWAENSLRFSAATFLSPGGHPIILSPGGAGAVSPATGNMPEIFLDSSAPGFAFCHAPAVNGQSLYLAPVGIFAAENPPASPNPARVEVMAGLFGSEFLGLCAGDFLFFQSGAPAWAGSASASSPASGALLSDLATTAWAGLAGGGNGRGYFNQPSESAYYGESGFGEFPMVVHSCLSDLSDAVTFPMVPYGAIAPGMDSQAFQSLEKTVFSPMRSALIGIGPQGPVFSGFGAQGDLYRPAAGNGLNTAFTPQGFLVNLNAGGGWQNLLLAQSPVDKKLFGFSPAGGDTLNTTLSGTLVRDQLFMVIANGRYLDHFANTLNVGGFNLEAAVDEGALLIFKFGDTRSLLDLIADTGAWTASDQFVGDDSTVDATRETLEMLFAQAGVPGSGQNAPGKQNPFAYFQQIAVDPEWTGVLVMDALVDGNGMPPDLQILLAGIPGSQLRAHHFGIQANNLRGQSPGPNAIKHSSVFGVIHYLAPPDGSPSHLLPGDFRYIVQQLTVVFANSSITTFNVAIELTLNTLFGRSVSLESAAPSSPALPENTILIHGQYQKSGAVGHVKFVTETPYDFVVNKPEGALRVIERIRLSGIALNPGKPQPATGSPADTQLSANFALDGQLWFVPEPFPIEGGLDLLSFGNPQATAALMPWENAANSGAGMGLGFTNLTILLSFTLYGSGAVGPVSYQFVPDAAQVSPDHRAIREGSLLFDLPLNCTNIRFDPKGLDPGSLGAMAVHCVQLESLAASGSPPGKAPSPYTTSSPLFALEFDLPLGSLGSLSSVHASLDASLFLAWGPSPVVPDSDAMSIMVKLPALDAGFQGFNIQGVLKTTFKDANLMKVEVAPGEYVYAVMFNNIAISVMGYDFPPGVMVDFVLFAGESGSGGDRNKSNIAWYLAAMPIKKDNKQSAILPSQTLQRLEHYENR